MLNQNFKEFIELLNSNSVKYMVVGGYALAIHGCPRYTKDIDGILVDIIDIDGLKENKRATGRLQDLADVEKLEDQT